LKRGARIGKQEYAEFQVCFRSGELCILDIARALLLCQFGFDHVGVRRLACLLTLLGEVEEVIGFVGRALDDGELGVGRGHAIVERHHCGEQAASRYLLLGRSLGFLRSGTRHGAELLQAECLVDNALAGVLVHGIIGYKARSRRGGGLSDAVVRSVSLGEEILIVVSHGGKQAGDGDGVVQPGDARLRERCGKNRLIFLREMDRLIERDLLNCRGRGQQRRGLRGQSGPAEDQGGAEGLHHRSRKDGFRKAHSVITLQDQP
jgi:hypothetical protein